MEAVRVSTTKMFQLVSMSGTEEGGQVTVGGASS